MKRIALFCIPAVLSAALMLLSAGCSKEEDTAGTETGTERKTSDNPLRAPGTYMRTVVVDAPRHAKETIHHTAIQQEINQFWGLKERYPASLEELEQWRSAKLPDLPRRMEYRYDPNTGHLEVVEVIEEEE